MQGFDQKFEQKTRPGTSDAIVSQTGGKMGGPVFKTTDVLFHERIAKTPFAKYEEFDVVAFSDYGRALYNKKEEGSLPVVDSRSQTVAKRAAKMQRRKRGGGG